MVGRTKLLLGAAIGFLVIGLVIESGVFETRGLPFLHVFLPVGAIFVGLFLVSRLFEKEDAIYGEDQKKAMADVGKGVKTPPADRA